ncbi:MAG: LysM peptidoglycan-binding domain-containing protein, partial [Bacteroidales bacterium]|nr:LysM peptidoglycan-binding domain-containing protein [Bacteroidales bacterium]
GSPLYLPIDLVSPFLRLQDSIYAYKDSLYLNLQPEQVIAANSPKVSNSASTAGKTKIYYTVRQGDTYSKIGSKYGVSAATVKSWNHKTSNMLHIGDKLVIYVAPTGKGNSAPKSTVASKSTTASTSSTAKTTPTKTASSQNIHTVKSGDTLWSISHAYGTTVENIKSLNGLTSSKLSVGMNLRIQ